MKAENNNIMKNGSGYTDTTACEAIKSTLKHAKGRNDEIYQAITLVKNLLNTMGLESVNRIHIKDKKTGKIYK